VASRFNREFDEALQELSLDQSTAMPLQVVFDLLEMLGFAPNHGEPEQQCMQEIWEQMNGDSLGGVTGANLKTFMMNVVGVPQGEKEGGDSENKDELCFYEGSTLRMKVGSHKKVFLKFKSLYIHRVQHVGLREKARMNEMNSS
jgi:hypothetical protein